LPLFVSFFKFGTVHGVINVLNAVVAASVTFNWDIVSTVKADLTVYVQDELSFFAPGNPLVNNSVITLTNQVTQAVISVTAPVGKVINFVSVSVFFFVSFFYYFFFLFYFFFFFFFDISGHLILRKEFID
jgi:hypothetical protein